MTSASQKLLTSSTLADAALQQQKRMLGERLFQRIQIMYPELAGKITDMFLEIDNAELLHMLESDESLKAKVEEAVAVLHQARETIHQKSPKCSDSCVENTTNASPAASQEQKKTQKEDQSHQLKPAPSSSNCSSSELVESEEDAEVARCGECSFVCHPNDISFEALCKHISSNMDCQQARKQFRHFIHGSKQNSTDSHIQKTQGEDSELTTTDLKTQNNCLLNNKIADDLDWESLRGLEGMAAEESERWRLSTFWSWKACDVAIPLALAHRGFVKVDDTTARCVFCHSEWQLHGSVDYLAASHLQSCRMVGSAIEKATKQVISHRCFCSFRLKKFFKDFGDFLDDSTLPAVVKSLWDLFKKNEDNVFLTSNALVDHIKALLTDSMLFNLKQYLSQFSAQERRSLLSREADLREKKYCRVCMDQPTDTVFLPCGHFMTCSLCANKLSLCAMCRKPIKGMTFAFVPSFSS